MIHSFYARYEVVSIEERIILSASDLRESHSFSYWDSLIVATALAAGADHLFSEDMQHNLVIDGQLTILNPFSPG